MRSDRTALSERLASLNAQELTDLVQDLLEATATAMKLGNSVVHVPENITTADGGEDARMVWDDAEQRDPRGFVTHHQTFFQLKATARSRSMTPAGCAKEFVEAGRIKSRVRTALERGHYVLVTTESFNAALLEKRYKTIRKALKGIDQDVHVEKVDGERVRIVDLAKLTQWVEAWPTVHEAWVQRLRIASGPGGRLSLESLANLPAMMDGMPFKRTSVLEKLKARLVDRPPHHAPHVVLVGMPAAGKTQCALQFAHRHRSYYGGHCYFVDASSDDSIQAWRLEKARVLGNHKLTFPQVAQALAALRPSDSPILLVLDNVTDHAKHRGLFRAIPKVHLLLTTHNSMDIGPHVSMQTAERSVEAKDDAVAFVRNNLRGIHPDQAVRLAKQLHHHPLALAQAVSLALQQDVANPEDFEALMQDFSEEGERLERLAEPHTLGASTAPTSPERLAVTTVWNRCLRTLGDRAPHALHLLHTCAFLHGNRINHAILTGPREPGAPRFTDMIKQLKAFSLVAPRGLRAFSTHAMLQEVIRSSLSTEEGQQALEGAYWAVKLYRSRPSDTTDPRRPHMLTVAGHVLGDLRLTEASTDQDRKERRDFLYNAGLIATFSSEHFKLGERCFLAALEAAKDFDTPEDVKRRGKIHQQLMQNYRKQKSQTPRTKVLHDALDEQANKAYDQAKAAYTSLPETDPERAILIEELERTYRGGQRATQATFTDNLEALRRDDLDPIKTITTMSNLVKGAVAYKGLNATQLRNQALAALTHQLARRPHHELCGERLTDLKTFSEHFIRLCIECRANEQANDYLALTRNHVEGLPERTPHRRAILNTLEQLRLDVPVTSASRGATRGRPRKRQRTLTSMFFQRAAPPRVARPAPGDDAAGPDSPGYGGGAGGGSAGGGPSPG